MEVSDRSVEHFVFATVNFDIVFVVVMNESTDDGAAFDWTDLFIEEATFGSDGEFQDVAFNEFGFRSVVGWDGIILAIWLNHNLTVENTFDNLFPSGLEITVSRGAVIASPSPRTEISSSLAAARLVSASWIKPRSRLICFSGNSDITSHPVRH